MHRDRDVDIVRRPRSTTWLIGPSQGDPDPSRRRAAAAFETAGHPLQEGSSRVQNRVSTFVIDLDGAPAIVLLDRDDCGALLIGQGVANGTAHGPRPLLAPMRDA